MRKIEEPRWLTVEQQAVWRSWLNAVNVIQEYLESALREFDLDLGEYEIMVHLSEAPDHRLRMSELADRLRHSRSRLTHTVTRMERQGLVARTTCPGDRRGVIAVLTQTGWELLVQAAPYHVQSVREALVDPIDPADFEALGRAMQAVVNARS
ncbi:MAG: MarR family transcriptional regulator [Propionicimonas sp.]|uniref:MarR family winged helix-turn-helix transcriptional regulator n=1 Tax=Propionicimonas sp. TaxID=1955623 RepID=UPI002B1FD702|nr:MarR family transcriptional regulator [Propionicimonas sp.]MEA4944497.1 MarR family transcriptional regulator [Propionicimonas sp.]MEA5054899.1 MarR family transcriptional regulator [Propionicimonas sp.]MEA5117697.1 MarR family transcriptional regulator [Propionicimonas sp.]